MLFSNQEFTMPSGNLDKLLYTYDSPFGQLYLAFTPSGKLYHCDAVPPDSGSCCIPRYAITADEPMGIAEKAFQELDAYFSGRLRSFSIPLAPGGTDFQKRVWKQLLSVPYGSAVSYQHIAAGIGSPKAQRAAGRAVGANPVLIFIPCHRAVPAKGGIGKFRAGRRVKKFLLELEGFLSPDA